MEGFVKVLSGAGIIGANGAGKSTLFRMMVGQEQPDSGELIVGKTVRTMYVDQSREALDSERSVAPNITCISWGLTLIIKQCKDTDATHLGLARRMRMALHTCEASL